MTCAICKTQEDFDLSLKKYLDRFLITVPKLQMDRVQKTTVMPVTLAGCNTIHGFEQCITFDAHREKVPRFRFHIQPKYVRLKAKTRCGNLKECEIETLGSLLPSAHEKR